MKKTNESGRSMVEMLGVLAIVGVLSVGGLAGYTTAMNKYRATEIMNAISLTLVAAESEGVEKKYSDAYSALSGAVSSIIEEITVNPGDHTIVLKSQSNANKKGASCQSDSEPCKTVAENLKAGGSFKGYSISVDSAQASGNKVLLEKESEEESD